MRRTLEITTKIGCKNQCVYCPQDKLIAAYSGNVYMNLNQFAQILVNTPRDIQIDFTGFCEPFLNPKASMMMRMACTSGYDVTLITTLAGFTEKDAEIISGIGFKSVMVHEFEGRPIDMDQFNAKEKLLRESVLTDKYERFKLKPEHRWTRAGNLKERDPRPGCFECGWTGKEFYRNVVLPNGDTYLCCMDYSLKHWLGNLFKTHYNNLDREQIVRLSNQENSDCLCRSCEMFKSTY